MTLSVTTLQALAEGVAQQLAANTDPNLAIRWQPDGLYDPSVVGIWMATYPIDPDRYISLSPRPLTTDPTLADAEYGLQVRLRGTTDPYVVWALRDAVRDVILGRFPIDLPNGFPICAVTFAGGTTLGQDAADRHQWSDNYVYSVGEHRARPY